MNTQAVYGKPRNKSMDSARYFKAQQCTSAEQWESFRGEPAPLWMSATIEDIARHIDMVYDAAKDHGVQLKWVQVEYGKTWEEICTIAKEKQSYKYTIGDYLPREAKQLDAKSHNGLQYAIRDYFGVYYITLHDCVCGFFDDHKTTCDNLTRHDVFAVRFNSYDDAKEAFDLIFV